jgi:hypothetical protein
MVRSFIQKLTLTLADDTSGNREVDQEVDDLLVTAARVDA